MIKLDKHRIYYEGIIDFFYKERMLSFQKALRRVACKSYLTHFEVLGDASLVFNCVVNVDRKSHEVDDGLKSLLNKYKARNDISSIRIDKMYMTKPIILYAYLRCE